MTCVLMFIVLYKRLGETVPRHMKCIQRQRAAQGGGRGGA
jgi:hypothetical protein